MKKIPQEIIDRYLASVTELALTRISSDTPVREVIREILQLVYDEGVHDGGKK